jgi:hypothetical protein
MSEAARRPDPEDPRRGMRMRPKRGRAMFAGTFVGLIVLVFAFILLVSQCSPDGGEGSDDNAGGVRPAAAVVDGSAGPVLGTT